MAARRIPAPTAGLKVFVPEGDGEAPPGAAPLKTFAWDFALSGGPLRVEVEVWPDDGSADVGVPLGLSTGLRLAFFATRF
jgi:hypothetical protein